MKELEKNLYEFYLPLPKSPLRDIRCYFIRGEKRHLLIDTAFNCDDCEQALYTRLDEIGAKIEDTDIFITHKHIDHSGLIGRLKRESNTVYASAADKVLIDAYQTDYHHNRILAYLNHTGIPEHQRLLPEDHVALIMKSDRLVDITTLKEGDKISVGGFNFEVLEVPGHSPGHLALWEPEKKYLFSGDHILGDISPTISPWDLENDYLEMYINSLRKVREMNVRKIFPAHRVVPSDVNARIDEIITHHDKRLAAIVHQLEIAGRPMNAYEIALRLKWDMRTPLLENLTYLWFASMETLAHLQNLRFKGRVRCARQGDVLHFSV